MAGPGCLASDPVVVVGAGLTGGLIALALARLGLTVIQVAPPSQEPDSSVIGACDTGTCANGTSAAGISATGACAAGTSATALSYGSLSLGATGRAWRNLERLHGPLGWTSCGLKLHDRGWLGRRLPSGLRVPRLRAPWSPPVAVRSADGGRSVGCCGSVPDSRRFP